MKTSSEMKTSRLTTLVALACLGAATSLSAQSLSPLPQTWLELTGLIPGPTYDWERSAFLRRSAYAGLLGNAAIAPLVARALDDADPGVRRSAYTLKVLDKRALAATLEPRDEDLARSIL